MEYERPCERGGRSTGVLTETAPLTRVCGAFRIFSGRGVPIRLRGRRMHLLLRAGACPALDRTAIDSERRRGVDLVAAEAAERVVHVHALEAVHRDEPFGGVDERLERVGRRFLRER